LPESIRKSGPEIMGELLKECTDLELSASIASIHRLIGTYKAADSTVADMQEVMKELQGRLVDELDGHFFLSLTPAEARRYEKWDSGWEIIISRFGEITRDVEEMNKCFALSRYTAAMFHALHVAEWGAIRLGDYMGVTDPRRDGRRPRKGFASLLMAATQNCPSSWPENSSSSSK
jgi:hypothetical protein